MSDLTIAALDIGSSSTKTVIAEFINDKLKILGTNISQTKGMKHGVIVDISKLVESTSEAIRKASTLTNATVDSVYASITSKDLKIINESFSMPIQSGQVTKSHIKNLINESKKKKASEFKGKHLVHTLANFIVDETIKTENPVGMHGDKISANTYFILSPSSISRNITKSIKMSGYDIQDIFLGPLANAKAVTSYEERDIGIAVIDIGAENSSISVIVENNLVLNKIIPIAGTNIDKDIAKVFGFSVQDSEKIKIKYGYAVTENIGSQKIEGHNINEYDLAEVIEARLEIILYHLKESLKKDSSKKQNPFSVLELISSIVITGGSSQIKDIDLLAEKIFAKKVETRTPAGEDKFFKTISNPKFSTAIGILKMAEENSNVYDEMELNEGIMGKMTKWYKELF